jgi:hypothetical protein
MLPVGLTKLPPNSAGTSVIAAGRSADAAVVGGSVGGVEAEGRGVSVWCDTVLADDVQPVTAVTSAATNAAIDAVIDAVTRAGRRTPRSGMP